MRSSLLLFLFLGVTLASQPIPSELKRRLKGAHSFHDLMSVATVMYKPRVAQLQRGNQHQPEHREIRIQGASFVALPSTSRAAGSSDVRTSETHNETQADMSILSTIRQGNDTCQLQSVCVPVPFDDANPEILIFPRCYEVTQCVGSCCDSAESCHPTAVEHLQKPVVEMLYSGHNKFVINQTLNITMEQHLACSCRDCSLEGAPQTCQAGRVIGASCQCECKNQVDKGKCKGNMIWYEESCTCGCPIRFCSRNRVLNERACECEERQLVRLDEPDENGNFRTDTSKLPRLRSKHRHNMPRRIDR